ncbi:MULTISPECIES: helix-turn-helix domain-containing protein [Thermoanaerobacterium]|uniref:XRE family transcriptional regulator n=2 Tax=Thermoanaerobacterium TaxID=28895 RepID=W9EDW6_9THEO|nr:MULTISPECIES: helix-turn-helix domain-containing protein [Thermoanaerobacterium]AFK85862.1 transcriptional regulator, XRE family [Thermoanaerobacterium saccharolyticum JW/SL-YS485]ETO37929.1 XRE family transcriptional regulator [Thermoanaerobacterium aotearoense SCUT27]
MLKDKLKTLRNEKKLTQRELAKLLNLSPSTIAMYEIGQRFPDPETLQKIADFFDVSVDYLLGRTDKRNIDTSNDVDERLHKVMQELGPDVLLAFYDLPNMTDEEKENVITLLEVIKAKREKQKKKG